MLPCGVYRVSQDVENPRPDKRKKTDWSARELIPEGTIVRLEEEGDENFPTIRRIGATDRVYPSDATYMPILVVLRPCDTCLGAILDGKGYRLREILAVLVETGELSLEKVSSAIDALEGLSTEEYTELRRKHAI